VTRRLSSPRFRRKLYWSTGLLLVLGIVVVGAIAVGNTGHSTATPIDESKPAWVYRAPTHMRLTSKDRLALFTTAATFVKTAVSRKELDSAWEMLGPEMRAGQTRKSWDTGFNNVVPFKADGIAAWDILYAYQGDVAMDLSLISGRGKNTWAGKTFTLELKRHGSGSHVHWLVAAWVPKGIGGGDTLSPQRRAGPPPPPFHSAISTKWLVTPLFFLGGLLAILAAWGLRGMIRDRRASRRYAEQLGYKSSSNPS
jgi:hypothetical protein